ncbi:hypothetical protein [Streptomyces sp. NBC_01237]|uniref:hypothetical protein n=1 Tax=Streptomyces sp. NBC_01237 TaxID=2903790 RepID=UPI002DD9FFF9|nr:hypothetical protein [Streptomyces sp. NBC_01237]WRZ78749.1 hypothetical protein OG251_44800 [Streptomyces sp. NBC_01237]
MITAGLLTTGCTTADDTARAPETEPYAVARTYQEAKTRGDWPTACALTSGRLRGGSVAACVAAHAPAPAPEPSALPSAGAEPPTYADGSTPAPRRTRTTGGPDRADTGPVSASGAVDLPATAEHPPGIGVLITYTVQWPGKDRTTAYRALRLVQEGDGWTVDQQATVHPGDTGHGSPLRAALGR